MNRPEEYFGYGSIKYLKAVLDRYGAKKVFLVTGRKSYSFCGAEKILNGILRGREVFRFSNFSASPELDGMKRGMRLFKKHKGDIVIAVGGGSVIDTAKLLNILSAQEGSPDGYIGNSKSIKKRGKPLIAIPTTAGTGSETTHFAVLYVGKVKHSIAHRYLRPDVAIVDPRFTLNLPPYLTATTGIDALSQAIESYWCVHSTPASKRYAGEAMHLAMKNLRKAVRNPDKQSREAMSKAAHLAGKAINITKTTAPHAVSYALTSYFGVSHGHAVGLTLPSFFVYNAEADIRDTVDKRGTNYVRNTISKLSKLLGCEDAYAARAMLTKLMQDIGLVTRLAALGIKTQRHIRLIMDNMNVERLKNNPRSLSRQSLRKILQELL